MGVVRKCAGFCELDSMLDFKYVHTFNPCIIRKGKWCMGVKTMFYSDDPVRDFHRHDADKERKLENLPICEKCRNTIQQEKAVYYNDQWICENCESEFWEDIREDFLERVVD